MEETLIKLSAKTVPRRGAVYVTGQYQTLFFFFNNVTDICNGDILKTPHKCGRF